MSNKFSLSLRLTERLADIDTERDNKRKEIINEYRMFLIKEISNVKCQIGGINEEIKPLEEKKNMYISQQKDYEKELQSICEHELIEESCWDGHRTNYEYVCKICHVSLHNSTGFKIVETRHF